MTVSYIALGANLGDAEGALEAAVRALASLPEATLLARSSFYRTAPVGLKNQPDFINGAMMLETPFTARQMLGVLFAVEREFGRQRSIKNAPRTLDLDLLLHGDEISDAPEIILPHPRMHERAFVLAPLAEIAPDLVIPGHGPVAALLAACADQRIERI